MTRKIVAVAGGVIVIVALGLFFIVPDVYNPKSVFYDGFYSGTALLNRLGEREVSRYPVMIGGLSRSNNVKESGNSYVVEECVPGRHLSFCAVMYTVQYEDINNTYEVVIAKIKNGVDLAAVTAELRKETSSVKENFFIGLQSDVLWTSESNRVVGVISRDSCTRKDNESMKCVPPNDLVEVFTSLYWPDVIDEKVVTNNVSVKSERISTDVKTEKFPLSQDVSDERSVDNYDLLPDKDNPKRIFFASKSTVRDGEKYVTFAAGLWSDEGEMYETAILFGDGEESFVAHWVPQLFTEEVEHQYKGPGTYTASFVAIPKSVFTKEVVREVQERKTKAADLPGLVVIKKLTIVVGE